MNRRAKANRVPWLVFGSIVLLAVFAKIFSPAPPIVPGPKGTMQMWSSKIAIGIMGPNSVNPAGTRWTGVWNEKTKDGKIRTALWTFDFNDQSATNSVSTVTSEPIDVVWVDNKTAKAIFTAEEDKKYNTSPRLVAIEGNKFKLVDPEKGEIAVPLAQEQLPGIIEGSWASPAGVLILCRNLDKFSEVVFDTKTNTLSVVGKNDFKTDIKANWPNAPKDMSFVTYRGGFKVDLATGKATKLFDYKDLEAIEDHWRANIQDGRLYPRKGGGYTSIAFPIGLVDIRTLDKDGKLEKNLLPRE